MSFDHNMVAAMMPGFHQILIIAPLVPEVMFYGFLRAGCMSSEFGVKIYGLPLSLFLFRRGRFSLFLWSMAAKRREKREERRETSYLN